VNKSHFVMVSDNSKSAVYP